MTRPTASGAALRAVGVASSAGVVLLAACILAPQSASANPGAATAAALSQTIRWSSCPKAEPPYPDPSERAECGTVKVPVDWAKPDGRKMEIAVARQKATDPEKRVGVLFSNPGGPGSAGLDDAYYADSPVEGYRKSIRARFDIIGFDPRGIGRSGQLRCDDTLAEKIPTRPRNAADFQRMRTLNKQLADSCRERSGPIVDHMDSESVARDMDAIRTALGEKKISFLGHSYGTLIGQRYARLFPDKLRALALDSAMDPSRPDARRFLRDGSAATEDAVQQLANWCEKEASCALKGQDVKAVVRQLFARADAGKLTEPGPHGPTRKKVTADQLTSFLSDYLGKWNPKTTAQQLAALHSGKGKVYWIAGTPDVAWRTVICRDYDFRLPDYAHYRALLKQAASANPHSRYNSQALDMIVGCQGWPAATEPEPVQAKGKLPPVLVVNAKHDLATPLPGAKRMTRAFPHARLATLDAVDHWLYRKCQSPLPARAIDSYLRTLKTPPDGTVFPRP
ncbi:pimeloyl-ACP methyl ester carboxylesterase [Streptomyces sp. 2333.5]|nr:MULTISPECIES: alpha/beta hydrolase [unclassified Streptomyces]PJJ02561.1 pimeloyl-ACP methyl ester carboxylesterase [Streptomyces sp. 2333.5]SEE03383.1 Pimeloyl-ACP methyl ester carboxylesterase [Streptomyces sp. 2112.2]